MATKYTTRLTADTSQHDNTIKKSANQVYQYSKRVDNAKKSLSNLVKTLAPLAGGLTLATGALNAFKGILRGTEESADRLDNAIYTTKATIKQFYQAINTGNVDGFLRNIGDIKKAAQEAQTALDNLGTTDAWTKARKTQIRAEIAYQTEIINNSSSTAQQKKQAQETLKVLQAQLKAINSNVQDVTRDAIRNLGRQLGGGVSRKTVTDGDIQEAIDTWLKGGTNAIKAERDALAKQYRSYEKVNRRVSSGGRSATIQVNEERWTSDYAKDLYTLYDNLLKNETRVNNEIFPLIEQQAMLKEEEANLLRKTNKQIDKGTPRAIVTPTTNADKKEPTTPNSVRWYNEQIKALTDEQGNLNLATIEGEDRYNEINAQVRELKENLALLTGQIEPATDELKEYKEWWEKNTEVTDEFFNNYLKGIANLRSQKYADVIDQYNGIADAVESVGSVFGALGDVIGESGNKWLNFTSKAVQGMGVIIEQTGKLVAVEKANAIASGVAQGAKEPFPANLVAISTILSTLLSVFASMPKFATGGIIGGATTVGDHGLARVNAGEMILNKREQTRLWHNLNGMGNINSGVSGDVVFRISGNDLVGTLNNYNNKKGRIK